ncbi:MAG: cobalamin B12-binding domain-containing protein [Chloroflexi bacterium]|nr:cobalamin B12-binding domain-containing protein [Chloroflexota bacterium]
MPGYERLASAILSGDQATAAGETRGALEGGADPQAVLDAMTAAMDIVGARFQSGQIFVPEMLVSARAMKEAMAVLEPILTASGIHPEHTAIIGSIKGDIHDIGKNIVAMMWRGANFEVVDLGVNVMPARFVEAAREHRAAIIGISALLSTTMLGMRDAVRAIRAAEDLAGATIIVGGAPVTGEFATAIGADAYAPNAAAAVDVARAAVGIGTSAPSAS